MARVGWFLMVLLLCVAPGCGILDRLNAMDERLVTVAAHAQQAALDDGASADEVEARVNAAVETYVDTQLGAKVSAAATDAIGHAVNGNLPLALGDLLGLLVGGGALALGRKRGFQILAAAGKAIVAKPDAAPPKSVT